LIHSERITSDEDENGDKIDDIEGLEEELKEVLKENMRRKRAREFLLDFGTHIPFGKTFIPSE
jgi:hypothetical protein